ncbi:MAG: 6-pyruvoyl tetrahydropterin synthase family protein [Methanobrevibacter sp.]|nr:6-pyruvoyl tetrahydropterin synthase family protein [Methanobrevibacter sp.]
MKIMINGINAGLRFSSAHIIPAHSSCGFIHGHSYFVDVEIIGERTGNYEFVTDFKDVKTIVRSICKKLDHRLLIPINNQNMKFKGVDSSGKSLDNNENIDSNELSVLDFCNKDYVEFSIKNKEYKIPMEDCVLLPLKHSSAEEMSQYFANILFEELMKKEHEIDSVSVCVNEGIGQGACFKKIS